MELFSLIIYNCKAISVAWPVLAIRSRYVILIFEFHSPCMCFNIRDEELCAYIAPENVAAG